MRGAKRPKSEINGDQISPIVLNSGFKILKLAR